MTAVWRYVTAPRFSYAELLAIFVVASILENLSKHSWW